MQYISRHVDSQLQDSVRAFGSVLIEGPRGCGKTRSAKQVCESATFFDIDEAAQLAARVAPETLLAGPYPRLLDEWQLVPSIWNQVRHRVDSADRKGLFVLTGSFTPPPDTSRHTGATRLHRIKMRPMTLQEQGISDGSFSISRALSGEVSPSGSNQRLELLDLLKVICRGGWPSFRQLNAQQALAANSSYLATLFDSGADHWSNRSTVATGRAVLDEVARTTGSNMSVERMSQQISLRRGATKAETTQSYLDQLGGAHILELLPGWGASLRSRYSVAKAPKRYLVDPSLAVAALKASPVKLMADLKTTGFLFENLVIRDLLAITSAIGAQVFHFRDESGLEVDAIIEGHLGNWGAVEVKLGSSSIDTAAQNLLKFASRIDTTVMGQPEFLAIITNTEYSYLRDDGVAVIAITALGI